MSVLSRVYDIIQLSIKLSYVCIIWGFVLLILYSFVMWQLPTMLTLFTLLRFIITSSFGVVICLKFIKYIEGLHNED